MGTLVIVAVACFILGAVVMQFLSTRFGVGVTVSRPTTTDGETVQLTTLVPKWATARQIGEQVEGLSLAAQARMIRQNEIVIEGQSKYAHEKWKKIKAKLDANGFKLSNEERRWWQAHQRDFNEDGVVIGVTDQRVSDAAESPRE